VTVHVPAEQFDVATAGFAPSTATDTLWVEADTYCGRVRAAAGFAARFGILNDRVTVLIAAALRAGGAAAFPASAAGSDAVVVEFAPQPSAVNTAAARSACKMLFMSLNSDG
jgi:hypothetical protein